MKFVIEGGNSLDAVMEQIREELLTIEKSQDEDYVYLNFDYIIIEVLK